MDLSTFHTITIPEGMVKKIECNGVVLWETVILPDITNLVLTSTDANGNIYNGVGYQDDVYLNGNGVINSSAQNGSVTTGFIPFKNTDIYYMKGAQWLNTYDNYGGTFYFFLYDANKASIGDYSGVRSDQMSDTNWSSQLAVSYDKETGITSFQISNPNGNTGNFRQNAKNAKYFRVTAYGKGAGLIITANEEIMAGYIKYKNWVKYSTEADDVTIYNGGLGYKDGYRIRSGGAEGEHSNASHTGYIPVKANDIVYLSGYNVLRQDTGNAINVYNSTHTNIGQAVGNMPGSGYGIMASTYASYGWNSITAVSTGVYKWVVPPDSSIRYMRVSGYTGGAGATMIVTVNEEIT